MMKRNKRRRIASPTDYNNSKKPKQTRTIIETNSSVQKKISLLEDLSNELLYEIFDYLLDHHAFQAFYDLNNRFATLFRHSNSPIQIDISAISKSTFEHYLKQIIKPLTSRIESFRLSNSGTDPCSLLIPIMNKFTQLSILCLNHIEANDIEPIVNHLSSLPLLSSLTIVSIDRLIKKNHIYSKLFCLPVLKYCEISIEFLQCSKSFSSATNKFSTIEHLIINHEISADQLLIVLSYVPELRRLSIGSLGKSKVRPTRNQSIKLNYLTHVSLRSTLSIDFHVPFNELEILVGNCFRQVQILSFTIQFIEINSDREYLNSANWQRLISMYMFNLHTFDFQCSYRGLDSGKERRTFENLIEKFHSKFWINHQWYFDRHYHQLTWSNAAIFYSRNSPKRKVYDHPLTENIWSTRFEINEDPIHHICIHNAKTIKASLGQFPYATELTLCEAFEVSSRHSIVADLNHFYPLKQLTKLSIKCHHFSLQQLIELLQYTSNVHTLTLDSIILNQIDSNTIQRNELVQLVSKTNTITKLTISKEITLSKIQVVADVFLQLEDLTMNVFQQDLIPIVRFLLSKTDHHLRYLSSLCISKQRQDFAITLQRFDSIEETSL